jgi:carbamoyltransferase
VDAKVNILGLNAYHADASAALLSRGELVAAIEEERIRRVKHCAGFPTSAVRACLAAGGVAPGDLDHVAISRDPKANFLRKIKYLVTSGGARPSALAARVKNAGKVRGAAAEVAAALEVAELRAQLHNVEHHRAHLASAFFASPFERAAVLSIDGFGDFVSTMWASGQGTAIEVLGSVPYPHSLGVLYTATSQWLGFDRYGDEGKVMGLAPYGKPRVVAKLREAIRPSGDGFELGLDWFTHPRGGVEMSWGDGTPTIGRLWSERFVEAFGPARRYEDPLEERHHEVAASLQAVTEEIVAHLARSLKRRTGATRLCLAGGVALNSVANGKLKDLTGFEEIYVQPAAGDGGTSLGAALWVSHALLGRPRGFVMSHASYGDEYPEEACRQAIDRAGLGDGIEIERAADEAALVEAVAAALDEGQIAGWFQGRMEFGPRALGNRSVLADPRRADMRERLNRRIKRREPFRPFAPAVLAERAGEWFESAQPSPAMLMVLPFREAKRAAVPAVVHVDGSGRLQTVAREDNPRFHALIAAFERRTGVPMVLNTSFNENEPIVHTPDEAVACFARTEMDLLALGPFLLRRRS